MNEHEGTKFNDYVDDAARIRFFEKWIEQLEGRVKAMEEEIEKLKARKRSL